MKKWKIFIIIGAIVCSLFTFVGCGKEKLATPTDFGIQDVHVLTWAEVEGARSYMVEVADAETGEVVDTKKRTEEKFSMSGKKEGFYKIRVKAVGDGKSREDSDWSPMYDFHKQYETGCVYKLINDNTAYEITGAGTANGEVTIEDYYLNKPVTRIANKAFRKKTSIKKVTFGANVREIGENAFDSCVDLESIVFSNGLKSMEKNAFKSCKKLQSVSFPDSLKVIPEFAFDSCASLRSIDFGKGVEAIGEQAFSKCSELTSLLLPNSLQTIDKYAFWGCSLLENVSFGSGLLQIGENAFFQCSLLTDLQFSPESSLQTIGPYAFTETGIEILVLPEGLVSIDEYAFSRATALKAVDLPNTLMDLGMHAFSGTPYFQKQVDDEEDFIYIDDWLVQVSKSLWETISVIDVNTLKPLTAGIAEQVFMGAPKLGRLTLAKSIRVVGASAFAYCESLWKIATEGLVEIGNYAFYSCPKLQQLSFNEGLKRIGIGAFYNCINVINNALNPKALLPNSVQSIGTYAFKGTGLWTDGYDKSGVVYAGNWVVGYNPDVIGTSVVLDEGTRGIADYAFFAAPITQISGMASSSLRYIGKGAFMYCQKLGTVDLGPKITRVEDYTFYSCTDLFQVSLSQSLTYIGNYAFSGCERLYNVDRDNDLRKGQLSYIGKNAFSGCTNLASFYFGRYVNYIGERAFFKCENLKEVILPEKVTEIQNYTFYRCSALETVVLGENVETIGEYAFSGCNALRTLDLSGKIATVSDYAFYKCQGLQILNVGDSVKTIGEFAFYGAKELGNLTVSSSVERIDSYAFAACGTLSSVLLSERTKLEANAFFGCQALTIYTDATQLPEKWNDYFNSSYRPIILNCTLSDDKTYVVSVEITENTLTYGKALGRLMAPRCDGYTFGGWALEDGGEVVYTADGLKNAAVGSVLYAVWN